MSQGKSTAATSRFHKYSAGLIVYTFLVILFGAYVRVTGSGAGCGQHWPTCHGEVVHRPESIETIIELTHRVTSGLDFLLTIGLLIAAFASFNKGHATRKAAAASMFLMCTEALVGAGLVLLRLVGQDDSIARVMVMPVHLANSFLLMGALTWTYYASKPATASAPNPNHRLPRRRLLTGSLLALLLIAMIGSITALGDTVYPLKEQLSAVGRIASDQSAGSHILQRLRIVHPLAASALTLALLYIASSLQGPFRSHGRALLILSTLQFGGGLINIWLSAPGWMQIIHLGVATIMWVVLLGALLHHRRLEADQRDTAS